MIQRGHALRKGPALTDLSGKKALLVEDDEFLRSSISTLFEDEGMVVRSASNGVDAMSIFEGQSFDFVLSDVQMPKMDGVAFLNEIQKIDPDLPLIVMTGLSHVGNASNVDELNIRGVLTKPFSFEDLILMIKEVLAEAQRPSVQEKKSE